MRVLQHPGAPRHIIPTHFRSGFPALVRVLIGALIAAPTLAGAAPAQATAPAPPYTDAKWNQEGCVAVAAQEQAMRDRLAQFKKTLAEYAAAGQALSPEQETAKAEMLTKAPAFIQEQQSKFDASCKGTYDSVALQDACDEIGDAAAANRMCAALSGAPPAGVKLVEDRAGMRRSVAWNFWGRLSDDKIENAATDWVFQPQPASPEATPGYTEKAQWCAYAARFSYALSCNRETYDNAADALASSQNVVMRAAGIPVKADAPAAGAKGGYSFSVEMIRVRRADVSEQDLATVQALSAASGLPWDLGEFVQYPRLHFQANVYDILVDWPEATFYMRPAPDADPVELATAPVTQWDGRGGLYMSSWKSWTVHAVMTPTPEQWALLKGSPGGALFASAQYVMEDGAPDAVVYGVNTGSFPAALAALNAAQAPVRDGLVSLAAKRDEILDELKAEQRAAEAEWQAQRAAAVREGLSKAATFAPQWPVAYGCRQPAIPADSAGDAELAAWKQSVEEFSQCNRGWYVRYSDFRQALSDLKSEYSSLGYGSNNEVSQALAPLEGAWRQQHKTIQAAITTFNAAMATRNARVENVNASRRADASRRQDYRDNRSRRTYSDEGEGRDYAAEFFEQQRNPPPSAFDPVTVPRAPTTYLHKGYY